MQFTAIQFFLSFEALCHNNKLQSVTTQLQKKGVSNTTLEQKLGNLNNWEAFLITHKVTSLLCECVFRFHFFFYKVLDF